MDRQRRDHAALDDLLVELGACEPSASDDVLLRIYRLVFPHAFAEETVLWPVIRREVPDGEELTLRVEQQHQVVNELVTALEQMSPDAPDRGAVITRLIEVLRSDVRNEEDVLLPLLEAALTPNQVTRLAIAWEVARQVSPTRAHPVVARRPPGNVIAALPLSLVDRTRDRIDRALFTTTDKRPILESARGTLTRAAHRLERMRFMTVGEDPSTHRR
jgi:hypothetical protein